jgi:hypothetical protein
MIMITVLLFTDYMIQQFAEEIRIALSGIRNILLYIGKTRLLVVKSKVLVSLNSE